MTDYTVWTTENLQAERFKYAAKKHVIETEYEMESALLRDKFNPRVAETMQVLRPVIEELQKRDDAAIAAEIAALKSK